MNLPMMPLVFSPHQEPTRWPSTWLPWTVNSAACSWTPAGGSCLDVWSLLLSVPDEADLWPLTWSRGNCIRVLRFKNVTRLRSLSQLYTRNSENLSGEPHVWVEQPGLRCKRWPSSCLICLKTWCVCVAQILSASQVECLSIWLELLFLTCVPSQRPCWPANTRGEHKQAAPFSFTTAHANVA